MKHYNEIQQQIADHDGVFYYIGTEVSGGSTRDHLISMTDYLTSFMHFDIEYCGATMIVTRLSN